MNAGSMTKELKSHENGKLTNNGQHAKNGIVQAPPGFKQQQSLQNLLNKPNNNLKNKEMKLIPPTMFKSTNNNSNNTNNNNNTNINKDKKPSQPLSSKPEPLTKHQLLQALNYLIEHDDDFNVKLHDAYIKSFNNMAL